MIKTLSVCLTAVIFCYIAFVGHYYYETLTTFNSIEQSQQNTTP